MYVYKCVFDLGNEGQKIALDGPELELRGISLMWVLQIKSKSSGAAAKSEPVSHPPAPQSLLVKFVQYGNKNLPELKRRIMHS